MFGQSFFEIVKGHHVMKLLVFFRTRNSVLMSELIGHFE